MYKYTCILFEGIYKKEIAKEDENIVLPRYVGHVLLDPEHTSCDAQPSTKIYLETDDDVVAKEAFAYYYRGMVDGARHRLQKDEEDLKKLETAYVAMFE